MDQNRPFTPEQLLTRMHMLRSLAVKLVSPNDADDLVQDTFAAALRDPPKASGSLDGWLVKVLRRAATKFRRREHQRFEHETRAGLVSTAARRDLPDLEVAQAVATAVLALREPYRSVLVRRYWEGKSPQAIANEDNVLVSVTYSRERRAKLMLREHLTRRFGKDWRLTLLAFGGIDDAPRAGLAVDLPRSPQAPPLATRKHWSASVGLVGGVGVVVAILLLSRYGWPEDTASRERSRDVARHANAQPTRTDSFAVSQPGGERQESMSPNVARNHSESTSSMLHGRLLGLHPELPWTSKLSIFEVPQPGGNDRVAPKPQRLEAEVEVTAGGLFQFELQAWLAVRPKFGGIVIYANDPWYMPTSQEVTMGPVDTTTIAEWDPVEIIVQGVRIVGGSVIDALGKPVMSEVVAYPLANDQPMEWMGLGELPLQLERQLPPRTNNDHSGQYRLKVPRSGELIVVARSSNVPAWHLPGSVQAHVEVGIADELILPPIILQVPVTKTGFLGCAHGLPLVRAPLSATVVDAGSYRSSIVELDHSNSYWTAESDDLGAVELGPLPAADLLITVHRADHTGKTFASFLEPFRIGHNQPIGGDISHCYVELEVNNPRGQRLDAWVLAQGKTRQESGPRTYWTSQSNGVLLAPGRSYQLLVGAPGHIPVAINVTPPDCHRQNQQHVTLEPMQTAVEIELALLDGKTPDRATFAVLWHTDHGSYLLDRRTVEREQGHFLLDELIPGDLEVILVETYADAQRADRQTFWMSPVPFLAPTAARLQMSNGGVTRLSMTPIVGGALTVTVANDQGHILNATCHLSAGPGALRHDLTGAAHIKGWVDELFHWPRNSVSLPRSLQSTRRLNDSPLVPGHYELIVDCEGYQRKTVTAVVSPGQTTEITVVLQRQ